MDSLSGDTAMLSQPLPSCLWSNEGQGGVGETESLVSVTSSLIGEI